jgi:hypothetical protein
MLAYNIGAVAAIMNAPYIEPNISVQSFPMALMGKIWER